MLISVLFVELAIHLCQPAAAQSSPGIEPPPGGDRETTPQQASECSYNLITAVPFTRNLLCERIGNRFKVRTQRVMCKCTYFGDATKCPSGRVCPDWVDEIHAPPFLNEEELKDLNQKRFDTKEECENHVNGSTMDKARGACEAACKENAPPSGKMCKSPSRKPKKKKTPNESDDSGRLSCVPDEKRPGYSICCEASPDGGVGECVEALS